MPTIYIGTYQKAPEQQRALMYASGYRWTDNYVVSRTQQPGMRALPPPSLYRAGETEADLASRVAAQREQEAVTARELAEHRQLARQSFAGTFTPSSFTMTQAQKGENVQREIRRMPIEKQDIQTKQKFLQSPTAQWKSESAFREAVSGVERFAPERTEFKGTVVSAQAMEEERKPAFQLPIFEGLQKKYQLPKKTFTVLEGRTSQEYYKTYPFIPKGGTPRISEPLQSFGKDIFGVEQGVPKAGKYYRKDWLGGYTEVSKPYKTKTVSAKEFEAIRQADIYAPMFVPFGAFTTTSMLRGASLNIRYPKINIKGTIKKTGKSAWANSLEMLKDTSAITGRKITVTEKTKPFSIPTKEDIFGKPRSIYYDRAKAGATIGETKGGYARTWETRFEASIKPKPREIRGISWWEAYESKQTGRRMLESWAMRKYKGLPGLKELRPSKYPLAVYKPKPIEVNKFELSTSFRNAMKPVSGVKYKPIYGLGIVSVFSIRTGAKAKTKLKPITTPMFKTPTVIKQKPITIQAPKYSFDISILTKTKTSLRTPPKQIFKPSEKQPPRPTIKQPPPYIPKLPQIYIPEFEMPGLFESKKKRKGIIKEKVIVTRMLSLKDLFGK